jgi:hypothetical protein
MHHESQLSAVLEDVEFETEKARDHYPNMTTAHEALGIIREEYVEFEQEVFKKQHLHDKARMRKELTQVAAMCVRAIVDLRL